MNNGMNNHKTELKSTEVHVFLMSYNRCGGLMGVPLFSIDHFSNNLATWDLSKLSTSELVHFLLSDFFIIKVKFLNGTASASHHTAYQV
jgi:hypothetical protein